MNDARVLFHLLQLNNGMTRIQADNKELCRKGF